MKIKYLLTLIIILKLSDVVSQELNNILLNKTYQMKARNRNLVGKKIELTQTNEIIILSENGYGTAIVSKYNFEGKEIWEKQLPKKRINDIQIYDNRLVTY